MIPRDFVRKMFNRKRTCQDGEDGLSVSVGGELAVGGKGGKGGKGRNGRGGDGGSAVAVGEGSIAVGGKGGGAS